MNSLFHKFVAFALTIEVPDANEFGLGVKTPLDPDKGGGLLDVMVNMIRFMSITLTTVTVLSLVTGAILYLQSYGKDPMIERAKVTIKWSIWGMVMGLLSFGIVQIITTYLTRLD